MENYGKVIAAWITGVSTVIAAVIGGVALLCSTKIASEKASEVVRIHFYPDQSYSPMDFEKVFPPPERTQQAIYPPYPTMTVTPERTQQPLHTPYPSMTDTPESTPKPLYPEGCEGLDWVTCWIIDRKAKTLEWKGYTGDGIDIGLAGLPLAYIREGYSAKVTLEKDSWIAMCQGSIDGVKVTGLCPVTMKISAGSHIILSPGPTGGFRIYD